MKYEVSYRPDEVKNNVNKYAPNTVDAATPKEAIALVAEPDHLQNWEWQERAAGTVLADLLDSWGYYLAVPTDEAE